MSPTSYQTAPPRINNLAVCLYVSSTKAAHYRDGLGVGQGPKPLYFKLFLEPHIYSTIPRPDTQNHKGRAPFRKPALYLKLHITPTTGPARIQVYYRYFTSSISYSTSPPGVRISATSPTSLPIKPRAMGELIEILLDLTSASSSPTIL